MRLFITVDVECYTGNYDREVYGGGWGLPFILGQCRTWGAKATFFVEALGATRWGPAGVERICRDVRAAGQEVQLHLHPVVAKIDGFADRDDVMCKHDGATQERLIRVGTEVLRQVGVSVSAFRAGDLAANEDTLAAMKRVGIRVGSNRDLDTKSSIRSRINDVFPVRNDACCLDGVLDIPVSAFVSPVPFLDGRYRHLEISALSLREMTTGLQKMAQAGYATAVVLTHPGEFFALDAARRDTDPKEC